MGMRVIDENTKKEFYLSDDNIKIVGKALQERLENLERGHRQYIAAGITSYTKSDFGIPEVKQLITNFIGE